MSLNKWLLGFPMMALIGAIAFSGCSPEHTDEQGKQTSVEKEGATAKMDHKEVGTASWYGSGFQGHTTTNGDTFDQKQMTAAHPSLPMGTKAEVTNLENGKEVDVTINDRGPNAKDRAIDLSEGAAKKLDMKKDGTAHVRIMTKSVKKKQKQRFHASKHQMLSSR
jgi:rare lipoprotein A